MFSNFGELQQALNTLTERWTYFTGTKPSENDSLEYSYITPTIIALGDFPDAKIDSLLQLTQREPVVIWNLGGKPLSAYCMTSFDNQIIDGSWKSQCRYTRAPVLDCIFSLCQSIKSWYDLNDKNLAVIHSPKGSPATGILIACLLKYIGAFETSKQAYDFYCSKRLKNDPQHTLAPSYRILFENVDRTVDSGGYYQTEPMHLKTLTIAGLPVDDVPCVEVWDLNGLVFSSHVGLNHTGNCTWNADYGDGFYRVSQNIIGDFSVICFFGGHKADQKDKTTLIFKYQNSTAFLPNEVVELKHYNVDINPLYADALDTELFNVHIMFDHAESLPTRGESDPSTITELPPYYSPGVEAFEAGLDEISKHHHVIPDTTKTSQLLEKGFQEKYVTIALQLANNSTKYGEELIGMMRQRSNELENPDYEDTNKNKFNLPEINTDEDDGTWELVDLKCPVCSDDNPTLEDQIILCCVCHRSHHTLCVGLRKIPFGLKTEKDRITREKYVKTHFGEWKCPQCVVIDVSDILSPTNSRNSHFRNAQSPTNAAKATTDDIHTMEDSGADGQALALNKLKNLKSFHSMSNLNSPEGLQPAKQKFSAMSTPTSRQTMGAITSGGGVIVTDRVRHMTSPTGQPWTPLVAMSNGVSTPQRRLNHLENVISPESGIASPTRTRSKHDQVATLMGLLAASGINVEDLNKMSETKQKEILFDIVTKKQNVGHFSKAFIQSIENSGATTNLDLKTALKGIITKKSQPFSEPNHLLTEASAADESKGSAESVTNVMKGKSALESALKNKFGGSGSDDSQGNGNGTGSGTGLGSGTGAISGSSNSAKVGRVLGKLANQGASGGGGGGGGSIAAARSNMLQFIKKKHMLPGAGENPYAQSGDQDLGGNGSAPAPKLKDIPEYSKYFKMIKVGVPKASIAEKMQTEGLVRSTDEGLNILNLDPDQPISAVLDQLGVPRSGSSAAGEGGLGSSSGTGVGAGGVGEGVGGGGIGSGIGSGSGLGSGFGGGIGGEAGGSFSTAASPNLNAVPASPMVGVSSVSRVGTPMGFGSLSLYAGNTLQRYEEERAAQANQNVRGEAGYNGNASMSSGGNPSSSQEIGPDAVVISEHPRLIKYFKMLRAGLSKDLIKEKMREDGVFDTALLDKDPNAVVNKTEIEKKAEENKPPEENKADENMVKVSEHPKYVKYFKMLKVGLPIAMVKTKMEQEGITNTEILDKDPNELIPLNEKSEEKEEDKVEMVKVSEHPKYMKYFKMLKVGLPPDAVKVKMQQEGITNTDILDKDPNELIPLDDTKKKPKKDVKMVKVSEHPKYMKYFKMLKVGLPPDAVKVKMQQEGVNQDMLDKDPNEMIPEDENAEDDDEEDNEGEKVPAGEHPQYAKFFKMLKVGMPKEMIKTKMQQEGVDPEVIEKEPTDLIPLKPKKVTEKKVGLKFKTVAKIVINSVPKVRKKKLYWKALNNVGRDSLWADDNDEDIFLDEEEFNSLFVDTGDKKEEEKPKPKKEAKKQVITLVDMKRAQNAGIALARIKLKFEDLRVKLMSMDDENLSTDQLRSIEEYLPTKDEAGKLKSFNGDRTQLGKPEQFMMVMLGFDDASKRIGCMIYKQTFKSRVLECRTKLTKIESACDDVKMSQRLVKVLKTILKVGNQLNDGAEHKGFALESLLKLTSAKAFDKKTSILQYVIMLIYRNDPDYLNFPEDLKNVAEASRVTLESVITEKNALKDEFDKNFAIVMDIQDNEPDCNVGSMIDFLTKADSVNEDLSKRIENIRTKYSNVLSYFGEEPSMQSTEFFSTLSKFIDEFNTTRSTVDRLRKQEEKKKAALQAAANPVVKSKPRRHSTMTTAASEAVEPTTALKSADDSVPKVKKTGSTENILKPRPAEPQAKEAHDAVTDSSTKESLTKSQSRRNSMI